MPALGRCVSVLILESMQECSRARFGRVPWEGLSCCRFEMYSHRWSIRGELACSAACLCSPDPEDKSLQSEKDFSKWCGRQAEKKEGDCGVAAIHCI